MALAVLQHFHRQESARSVFGTMCCAVCSEHLSFSGKRMLAAFELLGFGVAFPPVLAASFKRSRFSWVGRGSSLRSPRVTEPGCALLRRPRLPLGSRCLLIQRGRREMALSSLTGPKSKITKFWEKGNLAPNLFYAKLLLPHAQKKSNKLFLRHSLCRVMYIRQPHLIRNRCGARVCQLHF